MTPTPTDISAAVIPALQQRITELEAEIARLTSAGLNAAAGETIKADEANDYYAELERLRIAAHAAANAPAGEVLALRAERRSIFNDMYDLLSALVEQAGDAIWFDENTTAHEALCNLAAKYDPAIGVMLAAQLEEDC